jgi:predicted DNA-binding ribbon-helix-helix protein
MNIKLNNCKTDKDYFDIVSNMKLKGFAKTFMYNTIFKEISDTIKEIKDKSNNSSVIVRVICFSILSNENSKKIIKIDNNIFDKIKQAIYDELTNQKFDPDNQYDTKQIILIVDGELV